MGMYGPSYSAQPGGVPAYPQSVGEFGSPGLPPHSARSGGFPSSAKHEPGLNGAEDLKHPAEAADGSDVHRGKRWKGEPGYGEPDFIARGLVSEEEATMCFES